MFSEDPMFFLVFFAGGQISLRAETTHGGAPHRGCRLTALKMYGP